jgi:taurine---2-oxoglutarate transaminase
VSALDADDGGSEATEADPGRVSAEADAAERVRRDDRAHVFHSWSAQGAIVPIPIRGGSGSWFWDFDGNRYLDFAAQAVNLNLGHQHPRVVAAIRAQAEHLCTIAPWHANDQRGEAARMIAEVAPGDLNRVFFTSGGAEANENAIRMARVHTGRQKVFASYRSYHGATHGAITLTGDPRRWGAEPGPPGVVHFFAPYLYRSSFQATTDTEETDRALAHLRELLMYEGPHTVAAVIVEPVVGSNGVMLPTPGYLAGVREICDEHGILLISDEVLTGFGRCGAWFAVDRWGVVPDLITFAKGVNSGYVPLGGVLISDRIAETFRDRAYPGGLTYSGHPLACASAVASLHVLHEEGLVERARDLGERVFAPGLQRLADAHPSVGDARGLGCLWAIELVRDRSTREPLVPYAAGGQQAQPQTEFAAACKERGLWPLVMHSRLIVAPPLVITDEEAEQGLAIIDEALAISDGYAVG